MLESGEVANDAQQQKTVERVVGLLEAGVARRVDHDRLRAAVEADFHRFDGARIRDFIPVLVESDIRARILTARAS
jgi:hypothetical protein